VRQEGDGDEKLPVGNRVVAEGMVREEGVDGRPLENPAVAEEVEEEVKG
jgi:hypothetical protein